MIELLKFYSALTLSFTNTLIWPLLILAIISIFYRNISNFIDQFSKYGYLKKLKLPLGIEGEFAEKQPEGIEPSGIKDETIQLFTRILEDKDKSVIDNQNRAFIAELKLHFEQVHNFIYKSQYSLLQIIQKSVDKAISLEVVSDYFSKTFLGSDPLWNVSKYLDFLQSSELITIDNESVNLTNLGEVYLIYSENIPITFSLL